jgi:BON domain-containing protein
MRIRTIAIAGLAGVAVAYLFDPKAGSARRNRIRGKIGAFTRRRAMPREMPPLPVNVVPAPTIEAMADAPPEPMKAEIADAPPEPMKTEATDAHPGPMKAEATDAPPEPMKAEATDAHPGPMKAEIANTAQEPMKEAAAATREDRPESDDAIAGRIRMKVQERPDLDTGSLVVDVVQGVAFLRGDLKDRRQVDEVVDLTGAVPGVVEVRDLIHLPESPTESIPTVTPLGDAWNG